MSKYTEMRSIIDSVFNTPAWKLENIVTFPSNFVGDTSSNEYIRVTMLANGNGKNLSSVAGTLMIDIFTESGMGEARAMTIADSLDKYLVGKTKTGTNGNVQFMNSNFVPKGQDKASKHLSRGLYSIPFNFIGIQ